MRTYVALRWVFEIYSGFELFSISLLFSLHGSIHIGNRSKVKHLPWVMSACGKSNGSHQMWVLINWNEMVRDRKKNGLSYNLGECYEIQTQQMQFLFKSYGCIACFERRTKKKKIIRNCPRLVMNRHFFSPRTQMQCKAQRVLCKFSEQSDKINQVCSYFHLTTYRNSDACHLMYLCVCVHVQLEFAVKNENHFEYKMMQMIDERRKKKPVTWWWSIKWQERMKEKKNANFCTAHRWLWNFVAPAKVFVQINFQHES